MRSFGKIEVGFWQNPRVRALSDGAKLLLAYIFSCQHGNSVGCFVLPAGYVMADLRWTEERVSEHVSELVAKAFIERDEESGLTRIAGWWGHNTIENANVAKAAAKVIRTLPKNEVFAHAVGDLMAFDNQFLNEFHDEFRNLLPNEYRNPEPEPEPEPDPVPEPSHSRARDERAGGAERWEDLIEAFDHSARYVYGLKYVPKRCSSDADWAKRWSADGLEIELASNVFIAGQGRRKLKGKEPARTLGYFEESIKETLGLATALRGNGDGQAA